MTKFQAFFSNIASTLYNPAFYAKARKEGLSKSVKLTAALGALGAALLMLMFYAAIIPYSNGTFVDTAEALYPDGLVVTLARGELGINQPEPYYIKNTFKTEAGTEQPSNLVIFDTGDTLKGDAAANDTYVLVKKTYALAQQPRGGERAMSFSSIATSSTTTITKADVVKIGEKIRPYVRPVVLIGGIIMAVFGTLFTAAFWLAFHLLYLFVPGVLVYLFGRFRTPQLEWKESYVVAVYASIPVAILTFLLHLTGFSWPLFFYTLLVMLVALVNLMQVPREAPGDLRPRQ